MSHSDYMARFDSLKRGADGLVQGKGLPVSGYLVWGVAVVAYLFFRLWYDGMRTPLAPGEVDDFMTRMEGRFAGTGNDPAVLRAFLEQDDGKEFIMLNLVKAEMGDVRDPATGEMAKGIEFLKRYSSRFMPVIFRKGGHPVIVGRKVGGYVDAWNTAPDPGWTIYGSVRYRSRRDMMHLVMDPAFIAAHPEKILGTAATFSFPTQRMVSFYLGPRVSVALVLALAAALAHLALLAGA